MKILALLLAPALLFPLIRDDYVLPVDHEIVLRDFDYLDANWLPGHRGVDLAGTEGAPVRAARSGTVVYAGFLVDRSVISIEHDDGLRTTYLPVIPTVSAGDRVSTGQEIGVLDGAHCMTACLHWGAKRGDQYYDPMALLYGAQVRLYPPGG